MRNLSVYQRFAMIIAALTMVLFAVSALQILVLRDAVLDERRTTVRDLAEASIKILAHYEGEAKAGRIEPDKARQMAFAAISAMRWAIGQMNEITGSIAAAVGKQGGATNEIARSVQQAAQGAQEVSQNITGVHEASSKVNAAATLVLNAAAQLTSQSEQLETETGKFLGNIRAA
jgi:methyl-accepting chemotaxis protein